LALNHVERKREKFLAITDSQVTRRDSFFVTLKGRLESSFPLLDSLGMTLGDHNVVNCFLEEHWVSSASTKLLIT
jgi:hypothetical protein